MHKLFNILSEIKNIPSFGYSLKIGKLYDIGYLDKDRKFIWSKKWRYIGIIDGNFTFEDHKDSHRSTTWKIPINKLIPKNIRLHEIKAKPGSNRLILKSIPNKGFYRYETIDDPKLKVYAIAQNTRFYFLFSEVDTEFGQDYGNSGELKQKFIDLLKNKGIPFSEFLDEIIIKSQFIKVINEH